MDVNRYVGIPYLPGGSSLAGCDCWGLVRLVEMECFGTFLPSVVDEIPAEKMPDYRNNRFGFFDMGRFVGDGGLVGHLIPTDSPVDGDLALLHYGNVPCHVGVVIDGQLLHQSPKGRDYSRLARLTDPQIGPRIERFYHVA